MGILNIQIIKKNGKKEYVIMPYEEFLRVQEELDDYENLRCLRKAKDAEQGAPTISVEELREHLKRRTRKVGNSQLMSSQAQE